MKEFIEKLIERLRSEVNYNDGAEIGVKQAIETVNQLAEEYEREVDQTDYANIELYAFWQNHQWIPCSERLPEYGVGVLLQDTEGGYEFGEMVLKDGLTGFWDGPNGWWTSANHYVAWMPLPEPFRPKGE